MTYFVIRAIVSFGISFLLLLLLIRNSSKFKKEKCKKPIQVYYPSIFAALFLIFVLYSTTPKLFDTLAVLRNAYSFKQVTVASRQALPGVLKTVDGEVYHYNPFTLRLESGKTYNVSYTPWQKYIMNISAIEKQ